MADSLASGIAVPHILIPDEKVNMKKWSVVACDQFVYDQSYWDSVDRLVGNAPSTLRMMLPEAYLGEDDVTERIEDTKDAMYDYIEAGVLKELPAGFMLVERFIKGRPRLGLMVLLDLEQYEFEPGLRPLIRPTEQTIKNRIPPRMQIRMGAPVEMPHILALIDDPGCTVIEPVYDVRSRFKKLYDFELMQNGGRITGYFVDDQACIDGVMNALEALPTHDGMKIAVGDGNHSLATAKEVWNRAKQVLSEEEIEQSPLRYALCELINLNDPALDIEPIHRAITGINPSSCIQYIVDKLNQKRLGAKLIFSRKKRFPSWGDASDNSRTIYFSSKESNGRIELTNLSHVMMLEDLQPVLEQLVSEMSTARLEYIHGNDKIADMAGNYDTLCFTLPAIKKDEFMDTIVNCGVLPKKCFSLGEENEKRYYLESRLLIIPEDDAPAQEESAVTDEEIYTEEETPDADAADEPGCKHADPSSMNEEFSEELAFHEPIQVITSEEHFEELPGDAAVLEEIETEGEVCRKKVKSYRDDLDDLVDDGACGADSDPSAIIED